MKPLHIICLACLISIVTYYATAILYTTHPTPIATPALSVEAPQTPHPPPQPAFTVRATREGLVGHRTASGHLITPEAVFVALPDRSALGRVVRVEFGGWAVEAPVWDVGPHNTRDPYWLGEGIPAAALGCRVGPTARYGAPKNPAGIDLSDALWDRLKIPRNLGVVTVRWSFVR